MDINYRIGNITLYQSATKIDSTNTTAEELLASILIPAGVMQANSMMRIILCFSGSGTGTKTSRIRFAPAAGTSGAAVLGVNLGTSASYERSIHLYNNNSVASQKSYSLSSSSGVGLIGTAPLITSIDFGVNQTLSITSQKTTGTEAHSLEFITVQIIQVT